MWFFQIDKNCLNIDINLFLVNFNTEQTYQINIRI